MHIFFMYCIVNTVLSGIIDIYRIENSKKFSQKRTHMREINVLPIVLVLFLCEFPEMQVFGGNSV